MKRLTQEKIKLDLENLSLWFSGLNILNYSEKLEKMT